LAFSRARASGDRIALILNEQETKTDQDKKENDVIKQGKVTFSHVSFSYPTHTVPDLEDSDFTLSDKEILVTIYATCSGKTHVFHIIPKLYQLKQDTIFSDDIRLDDYPVKHLRDSIGYVSQIPLLFTGSRADNIRFDK